MALCLIGLGSNLGNRGEMLEAAVDRLGRRPQVRVVAVSPWLQTSPVGGPPGQAPYLNGAMLLETALEPQALLELLLGVETELGRRRPQRWGPRSIDLDLLLYDQLVLSTPTLVVPHPRMAWRRFVLQPAATIASGMLHPALGWTIGRLWDHVRTALPYVAITGTAGIGKTFLAERLARHTGARLVSAQGSGPIGAQSASGRCAAKRTCAPPASDADSAGHAWQAEIEFLGARARLLAADAPEWSPPAGLSLSDFWFDQSLAYARVCLSADRQGAFYERWAEARRRVVPPKLVVLLDVPAGELLQRVGRPDRPDDGGASGEWIERVRQSILAQAAEPDVGPLLRAGHGEAEQSFVEVLAAIEAMEGSGE